MLYGLKVVYIPYLFDKFNVNSINNNEYTWQSLRIIALNSFFVQMIMPATHVRVHMDTISGYSSI